jgi:pyruvate dehydrogenase E1 component beta subunit
MSTSNTSFAVAIREALAAEMQSDEKIVLYGEDVAAAGGVFKVTDGLFAEFGPERVRDTPISEMAICGMALGAALMGLRPVLEIMFADFYAVAFDQIVNQIAKYRYITGGQGSLPIVIRAAGGAGTGFASQHSQSPAPWLMHFPGIKVVAPSTPRDAYYLMRAAIRDDNPVCFFEHKALYWSRQEFSRSDEVEHLGRAAVRRQGEDVTIVASELMVGRALGAAQELDDLGVSAQVVDLRSIVPLDYVALENCLRSTGRLVTVEEAPGNIGWSNAVVAWACEGGLVRPGGVRRVGPPASPVPFASNLEESWLPGTAAIADASMTVMERARNSRLWARCVRNRTVAGSSGRSRAQTLSNRAGSEVQWRIVSTRPLLSSIATRPRG